MSTSTSLAKQGSLPQREHDFLSFLAVLVQTYTKFELDLTLLSVLLDESALALCNPLSEGAYFSVTTVPGRDLLDVRKQQAHISDSNFPELVAIKTPLLRGELNNERNQKIWSSMAMELQVLKNKLLSVHPNIVSLLGICWQTVKAELKVYMPVIVLEAAYMDFEAFCEAQKIVTRRKTIGLALDICSGIKAVHDVGIIHCDIKPKNILIFKDDKLEWVAKIADFGSALFVNDLKGRALPTAGTDLWQAPECVRPVDSAELIKADTYSLGLNIWNLLTANLASTMLKPIHDCVTGLDAVVVKAEQSNLVRKAMVRTVELRWKSHDECRATLRYEQGQRIWEQMTNMLLSALALEPSDRSDAGQVLEQLKLILVEALKIEFLVLLTSPDDTEFELNPQEKDVYTESSGEPHAVARVESHMEVGRETKLVGTNLGQKQDPKSSIKHSTNVDKPAAEKFQKAVQDGKAVVKADSSLGMLRSFPSPIIDQLCGLLTKTANDVHEGKARRAEAGYQFAVLRLEMLQVHPQNKALVDECLKMLSESASLDHLGSQSIVGHCYKAFGRKPPFDIETERQEWLIRGVKHGSQTAKRRLKIMDPGLYQFAIYELRTKYNGIGSRSLLEWEFPSEIDLIDYIERTGDVRNGLFWATILGYPDAVLTVLAVRNFDINEVNERGQSALLLACRSGHPDIVRQLLNAGADPSIASEEGFTPLHFLAAFADRDVVDIATRLIKQKAPIEARTSKAANYRFLTDSTFGPENGTPLLWAVVADNKAATQILASFGADPFDTAAQEVPTDDKWSHIIHTSPILHASKNHQYELLEILLAERDSSITASAKSLKNDTTWKLNHTSRHFGTQGRSDTHTPLAWCVAYQTEGLFDRLLYHTDGHEAAFAKTFDILVRSGADPFDIDGKGLSILTVAVDAGQPFVIDFLMSWNNGCLRPSPKQWQLCLVQAVLRSDHLIFDTLMKYSMVDEVSLGDWRLYFGTLCHKTNDIYFLDPFRTKRDPEENYAEHFAQALLSSNFATAQWFYSSGKCDLTTPVHKGYSVLGLFIKRSKIYTKARQAVRLILDLDDVGEEVFYNISEIEELQWSALHQAVFHPEYTEGAIMADWVVHKVVEKWYEPQHINYQIPSGILQGQTPLHVAVSSTNLAAVRYLLEEEGENLDLTLLDAEGRSVLDTALELLKSQKQAMEFWEVPEERQEAADMEHWSNTLHIIGNLMTHGAKHHKYSRAVTRCEPDDLQIFDAEDATWSETLKCPELFQMSPEELETLPIWLQKAAKLPVNSTFWIVDPAFVRYVQELSKYDMLRGAKMLQAPSNSELSAASKAFKEVSVVDELQRQLEGAHL